MKRITVFVGLDYHQHSVQVCIMNREGEVLGNRRCENDRLMIVTYVEQFGTDIRAAIESCVGASDFAEELLQQHGWSMDLAHPGYVHRMKQNPDKSDYTDARMLADLIRVGYLPKVWLAPSSIRELRRLIRYRQQIAQSIRNTKLRMGALLREHRSGTCSYGRWTLRWIDWAITHPCLHEQSRWIMERLLAQLRFHEEERRIVEKQLQSVTGDDAVVHQLMSFTGIGPVTAWTLRAEIGRFDRFRSGKQLSRFCGLSPRNASSGNRQADAGLIRACNRELRRVLIETAHRLARLDARWSKFAQKKRSEGKSGSVVAAAVANRWIRWLYHQMVPVWRAA